MRGFVASVALAGMALSNTSARAEGTRSVQVVSGGAYSEAMLRREAEGVLQEIKVRRADETAFGYARRYEDGEHQALPGPGADGRVTFVKGSGLVRVFCLVQQLCDIELQQGETVTARVSSNDVEFHGSVVEGLSPHVVFQPLAANTKATLRIYTNRRDYTLELIGTDDPAQHMPLINFTYPEEGLEQRWRAAMKDEGHVLRDEGDQAPSPLLEVHPDHMNLNYTVSDNCGFWWWSTCHWRPLHVYDDGEKTIIEMSEEMLSVDAPVVFVSVPGHKMAQVNFQLEGRFFVLQRLFERAYLIKGRGWHQEKVRITRRRP
jgi:type IV secretion system protein VirB9